MVIKRYCQFVLSKKNKEDEFAYLRYRVKWAGCTLSLNIGYTVSPSKWSTDTQRCKINTSHGVKRVPASTINRAISELEQAVQGAFSHFELLERIPTIKELRDESLKRAGADIKTKYDLSFFEVFDRFYQTQSVEQLWEKGTRQKINQLRETLSEFDIKLTFPMLDKAKLTEFVVFLRDEKKYLNSTIKKKITLLKSFLNWATAEGYNKEMSFKSYSPKMKDANKPVIFLDWDELMRLYELEGLSLALENVRDVFCFCCFTGLRYSDVANLKRANVRKDHIIITTIKTSDLLKIELNQYSEAILAKHKDNAYPNQLALPVITNQKMNARLKELCEIAGFTQPISLTSYRGAERIDETIPKYKLMGTHAGRRTFICNALMLGIPPEVVMKWTGHSDYKSMKPYIAVSDKTKERAMSLFNKR